MTPAGYIHAMAHDSSVNSDKTARAPSALERLFRNPDTGELAIVQFPNLPLSIFLIATAVRLAAHPRGGAGTAFSIVGAGSLAWWSVDEIVRGDSWFRRGLGAVVLVALVLSLVMH